ncbi:MAG: serine/threonine-protein kinase PknK, partial [Oligoflexales bacterium]|nr:serine/threonine-protein kinase PknK [Oligoflexales bacterium]
MNTFLKNRQIIGNGRYELIRKLGKGGFSQTFEAYDHSTEPPGRVAIKWLLPELGENYRERLRDDYFHECIILEKINHPGIIKIIELGREDGLPYLVMELLKGGTIVNRLARTKDDLEAFTIEPGALLDIAITLSEALNRIHSNEIIHGDIKPANIGFRELGDQIPVLFDFGHAFFTLLNEEETRQRLAASLSYMPPERIGFLDSSLKASSDLYSLGVTLYEIATGNTVFSGGSHQEICEKILGFIPSPLERVLRNFPGPLSDIIEKLMRKQPNDRYSTAFGLLQDLKKFKKNMIEGEIKYFALGTSDAKRELNYRIPMTGREKDMTRLHEFLKEADEGGGGLLLIGAPSGVGKTRLAREFLASASQRGFLTLRVKFTEFEQNIPLSAVERAMPYIQEKMDELNDDERKTWHNELLKRLGSRGQL